MAAARQTLRLLVFLWLWALSGAMVDRDFTLVNDWLQLNNSKSDTMVRCVSSDARPDKITFSRFQDTGQGSGLPKATQKFVQGAPAYALIVLMRARGGAKRFGAYMCESTQGGVPTSVATLKLPPTEQAYFLPEHHHIVVNVGENVVIRMEQRVVKQISYRWRRNGQHLAIGDNRLSLSLKNVTLQDSGVYEVFYEGLRAQGLHGLIRLIVRSCPAGKYGAACDKGCPPCYNGGVCHDIWGSCICPAGFMGDTCEQACGSNLYGANCDKFCSPLSKDEEDKADDGCGSHLFCKADPYGCTCGSGSRGLKCDKVCEVGTFGPDCAVSCHCAGDLPCNRITGACPGNLCAPGWKGPTCQVYVPLPCATPDDITCSCHCLHGERCDPTEGCTGGCDHGWDGKHCNVCAPGYHGNKCDQICSCANQGNCDPEDGSCTCPDHWAGEHCTETTPSVTMEEFPPSSITRGQSFEVVCMAQGTPLPSLSATTNSSLHPASYSSQQMECQVLPEDPSLCRGRTVLDPDLPGPMEVSCLAHNAHGTSFSSVWLRVYEEWKMAQPPVYLMVKPTAIHLEWSPASSSVNPLGWDSDIAYQVLYQVAGSEDTLAAPPVTDWDCRVEGLHPDTLYLFSVRARGENGFGPPSEPLVLRTPCGEPLQSGIPQEVKLGNLTHNSADISWLPPPEAGLQCQLRGYELEYRSLHRSPNSSKRLHLQANQTSARLEGLQPHTDYTVKLYPVTVLRSSFSAQLSFVTHQHLPSEVVNLHSRPVESTALLVMWNRPPVTNGELQDYKVVHTLLDRGMCQPHPGDPSEAWTATNQYTIQGLFPHSVYTVSVQASTDVGLGPPSDILSVTKPSAPTSAPPNISVTDRGQDFLQISWDQIPCLESHGPLQSYSYRLLDYLTGKMAETGTLKATSVSVNVSGLLPYTQYSFTLAALNTAGEGPFSPPLLATTLEAPPLAPTVTSVEALDSELAFSWQPPSPPHGELLSFHLQLQSDNLTVVQEEVLPSQRSSYYFSGLALDTLYLFQMRAETKAGWGDWSHPHPARTLAQSLFTVPTPYLATHSGRNVLWFENNSSDVELYRVVVEDTRNFLPLRRELLTGYWEAQHKGLPYYVTGTMDPLTGSGPCSFVVGDGTTQGGYFNSPLDPDLSYRVYLQVLLRHPLVEKSYFSEPVSTITTGVAAGYARPPHYKILGLPWVTMYIIIIATFVVVSLFLAGIILAWRRRKRNKLNLIPPHLLRENSTWSLGTRHPQRRMSSYCTTVLDDDFLAEDENSNIRATLNRLNTTGSSRKMSSITLQRHKMASRPVPLPQLESYIRDRRLNPVYNFATEFQALCTGQTNSCSVSKRSENIEKNRILTSLPYDYNRVTLEGPLDYINASYIQGYRRSKEYIATQAPTTLTYPDFWRMVWDNNVITVVMLTGLMEDGQPKCGRYWPEESGLYGDINVLTVRTNQPDCSLTSRTFLLKKEKSGETHRVEHLLLEAVWPDVNAPEVDPTPLLNVIQASRQAQGDSTSPLVIHCSGGGGRTGVFLAVDWLLHQLEQEAVAGVFQCVNQLRLQRNCLVQTLPQYMLIYHCLLAWTIKDSSAFMA